MNLLALPSFLLIAILAGLAASITGGIAGTYVIAKRISSIAGSISHSILGGMGLFLWLKRTYHLDYLSPIGGAMCAAILSAFLIGWTYLKFRERMDTIIAIIWSTGMAIGVIFITLTPGYNVELMDFLFGNVLWVSKRDLFFLLFLDFLLVISCLLFHNKFLAICFDEEVAKLQKKRVDLLYIFLLSLVAISTVLLIQVVGAVLVISMLALPPSIAATFTHKTPKIMMLAICFGALFTLAGILIAYHLNWPPGATISLVATAAYMCRYFLFPKKAITQ